MLRRSGDLHEPALVEHRSLPLLGDLARGPEVDFMLRPQQIVRFVPRPNLEARLCAIDAAREYARCFLQTLRAPAGFDAIERIAPR